MVFFVERISNLKCLEELREAFEEGVSIRCGTLAFESVDSVRVERLTVIANEMVVL